MRPTAESIAAGFEAMLETEEGTLLPNFESSDPAAYPLVKVDYAMVPTNPRDDEQAHAVADLLDFAVGDGQDLLPPGFIPLPEELRDRTRLIASGLIAPAATTTTTTAPVTTVPFDPNCCGGGGTYDGGGSYSDTTAPLVSSTSGAKPTSTTSSATTVGAATTTTVYSGAALPVRSERVGVAMMLGTAGLSLVGWASSGVADAAQARRKRLRRPRGKS